MSIRSTSIPSDQGTYRQLHVDHQSTYPSSLDRVRPFVSLVVPAYNESAILEANLAVLYQYMQQLGQGRGWELEDWEIVVVNDGSRDNTGEIVDDLACRYDRVRVIHHRTNMGLGQALRTGFEQGRGEYFITLDLDLSYSPDHIERLLDRIEQTHAKVVVASPYMRGGKVSNVPWLRLVLSIWANRFLSFAAKQNVSTLTGMVRAYDADFLKTLPLRSTGMEINPEVLHKTMLLGGRIDEVPAHLHWLGDDTPQDKRPKRKSSMKILKHIWATFYSGFVLRPVMFFIIPSLVCFLLAMYSWGWVTIHSINAYFELLQVSSVVDPTDAIAQAFQYAPHTFFVAGMSLVLAVQLFGLGILAVQSKRYFEEMFYLESSVYRRLRQ
jgi:glycosyltransferase involved in cell wall biosynthesis